MTSERKADTAPIMEVKNLRKTFLLQDKTGLQAVQQVSFTLFPGECLGIVGESGSGKSTIAKLVTGLLDITEGTVTIDGQDIQKANRKQRKEIYGKIQMVFQNPDGSFDPRRTLGDGIGESLKNRGIKAAERKKRVEELLVQCGLAPEFASRYPHEVSGGECQRAAIARALAVEPKILICDEATSSLDVTVQKRIMDLLISLRKEKNLSILFICHNLALVQMFCDRVLVLYNGRIAEEGLPEEIIKNPQSEYTKILVDSVL